MSLNRVIYRKIIQPRNDSMEPISIVVTEENNGFGLFLYDPNKHGTRLLSWKWNRDKAIEEAVINGEDLGNVMLCELRTPKE